MEMSLHLRRERRKRWKPGRLPTTLGSPAAALGHSVIPQLVHEVDSSWEEPVG
jgi:hypothetical protein